MSPPLPPDEAGRLAALERYAILDTPREPAFDDLARLAALLCDAPLSVVNFVAEHRQWAKAIAGPDAPGTDPVVPRIDSFCAHTVAAREFLEVRDATRDARFAGNPLVSADPPLVFYAGAPIITPDGHALGAVCIVDHVPRQLTASQREALEALGRQAARELELRQHVGLLEREIEQRAATEAALFEREEQLHLFVQHTPAAVAMFDREMRYILASSSWRQQAGLAELDLHGRTFADTVRGIPVQWVQAHRRALAGEVQSAEEDPWPQPDGRVEWLRWECRPWFAAGGLVGGVVVFVEFVTERRRAAHALAQSEARNRRLAEATLDGVLILEDGLVIEANRRFLELFGYEEADALGRPATDFTPASTHELVTRRQREGFEGTYQSFGLRRDGSQFPLEVSVRSYPFDGRPARVVMLRDVTERYEIDRLKNEFVSTVSHELRTPLTSIRGSLGLIEAGVVGDVSPRARELTRIARSNADRLIRLINDILDLEKMEAGRLEMRIAALDPADVVTTTLEVLQTVAEQRKLRLVARLGRYDRFLGDRDRVVQVLTNLVSNAIKFSPDRGDLTVRTGPAERPGFLRFSVEDTGPGIPPDKLSRLFRKFSQVDASDARARGGTGLGLAISRSIVEQLGGEIGVSSTPNVLTQFWFDLPLAEVNATDGTTIESVSAPYGVLVVEDDRDLADILGILLEHEGFEVTHAATLAEARQAVARRAPAVVLLDVTLPDGDGLAFLAEQRAAAQPLGAPAIVLSGHDPHDATLPVGVREWLTKPCDESRLFAALRRAVRPPGPPRALVVDSDPESRAVRAAQLVTWGVDCEEAGDGTTALQLARVLVPDLIVLDPALAELDGFALVSRLRQGPARSTPLLVHTSRELTLAERKSLALGPTLHLVKTRGSEAELERSLRMLLGAFTLDVPELA